ncbi:hypothetical protein [Hylemonella gracilis]|uniref:hypothetical protein n=1 Tax=Hylemonella gracilis TaxID=80880 RepID=UPI0010400B43|nr:hypothetical protein [Hylemonella gracilis]
MSKTKKSLCLWLTLTILTLLLYCVKDLAVYPSRALPLIWVFFSWNFLAYGIDKGMWPVTFIELDGNGKGNRIAREVMLWLTSAIYLSLLGVLFFSE